MKISDLKVKLNKAYISAHSFICNAPEIISLTNNFGKTNFTHVSIIPFVRTNEFRAAYYEGLTKNSDLITSKNELINQLRTVPELKIFDGLSWIFNQGASPISLSEVGNWLILRSFEVGVAEALHNLQQYIDNEDFEFERIIFVSGIDVERPQQLAKDISIVPFTTEKPENLARIPTGPLFMTDRQGLGQIRAAFIQKCRHIKQHEPIEKVQSIFARFKSVNYFTDLDDAMLCASLLGPSGPAMIANTIRLSDNVPLSIGSGVGQLPYRLNVRAPYILLDSNLLNKLEIIHTRFCEIEESERKSLRVPLTRLNLAMRGQWNVYSAVDLGIALENLFTDEQPFDSSISFTLRLRAARLLRDTVDSRKELAKFITDLYKIRSKAAHTGELLSSVKGLNTDEILERGTKETAAAIEYFIINGRPNWDDVIFS